jgi:hypothetical protein
MSHIVTIQTEVRDVAGINAACIRLQLAQPVHGEHQLYSNTVSGWAVRLTDWRYPIVCQTDTGRIEYDHFEGRWGDPQRLDQFLQAYAVEKAKLEARKRGHTAIEQPLADGSIQLTIHTGAQAV